jgi:signal transduction histidine kinase
MSLFLGQVLTLLTTSSGDLIYHLVLVFTVASALLVAIHYLRASKFPQAQRTVFGLSIILGLQVVLFIISGTFWQNLLNQQAVLPPLDRAVTLLTLIWIVWLWAFPEPAQLADAVTLLFNLLGMMVLGLTLVFWVQNPALAFNLSGFEIVWQVLSLFIVVIGVLMLVIRKPNGWGVGLTILILAFLGHLVALFLPTNGDFPGFVRLTQIAMFPLLMVLPQRFPVPPPSRSLIAKSAQTGEPIKERRRYSADPKTFQALMSLAAENDADKIGQAVTRGVAQAMLADLCFLVTLREDKSLAITCGYDLVREEVLKGTNLSRETVPLLAATIERGRPLRLPASSTSVDLRGLGQILGLPNAGHLLSIPIVSPQHGPLASILILSPSSNRLWNASDQTYLSSIATLFLPILERIHRIRTLETEREQSVQEAHSSVEQAADVQRKYEQAVAELENLREDGAQAQLQAENVAALVASSEMAKEAAEQLKNEKEQLENEKGRLRSEKEQLENESGRLRNENEQLRNNVSMLGDDNTQLRRDLDQSLEEVKRLQSQPVETNVEVKEPAKAPEKVLEKAPEPLLTDKQAKTVTVISQELRRSLSSIAGYTDLLMGESVGILGTLQRKFLERVQASSERLASLVDDLTQITQSKSGMVESKPELIDLNLIIDNAMAYTSSQIREKDITLRLDLAESTPRMRADRDTLQQILIHLLQNATAATQPEGSIALRVQLLSEDDYHFLVIQVTDGGGGIAPEDIPRVFSRRYRAEGSLIPGLGDTGVGLSIAEKLVEAQNGRIWVATEPGEGSTFGVLLPVVVESP